VAKLHVHNYGCQLYLICSTRR